MFSQAGGTRRSRGLLAVHLVGGARPQKTIPGLLKENPARNQLLVFTNPVPVVDGGHRNPQQRSLLDDFSRRVRPGVVVHDLGPLGEARRTTHRLKEIFLLPQFRAPDQDQEIRELLRRVRAEPHVPVGRRLHRRRFNALQRTRHRGAAAQAPEEIDEIARSDVHHLEQ